MKKCTHPDHPHCTQWVAPGSLACAGGHVQPVAADALATRQVTLAGVPAASIGVAPPKVANPAMPGMAVAGMTVTDTKARNVPSPNIPVINPPTPAELSPADLPPATNKPRAGLETSLPFLHFSGFDPRAAGGRQTLKIELLGMVADTGTQLELSLRSELLSDRVAEHVFVRTTRGYWRPVLLEFSSKNREHGQYRIDIELKYLFGGKISRKWVCTPVLLVPRPDATLADIHQIFMGRHKNVKVMVDDASIAKISGYQMADQLDISSKNASIAQLDFSAPKGKIDVGFTSIAWDEDLLEIDLAHHGSGHPQPCNEACLSNPLGQPRAIRLFAKPELVLGRLETIDPAADILLAHYREGRQETGGLTRRISLRHAVIHYIEAHFEIEDISRYGLLIDGKWPGKLHRTRLQAGMVLELTASFKQIVRLQVRLAASHALVLQRMEADANQEILYVLAPEQPVAARPQNWPEDLPCLFHQHGGFWQLDAEQNKPLALTSLGSFGSFGNLGKLAGAAGQYRFAEQAYPHQEG